MKSAAGFTLVELITIIILLGILSSYAFSRWSANSELVLPNTANLLAGHIRHIQNLSNYWQQPLRLNINGNGYWVSCINASTVSPCNSSPILDPATNQGFNVVLSSGISLSGSTLDFDTQGRPVASGALIGSTPAATYTLSVGGSSAVVSVAPITGFTTVTL